MEVFTETMNITTPTHILSALAQHKNVLLYGPPGTGKTFLLSRITALIEERENAAGRPAINLGNARDPFGEAADTDGNDKLPANVTMDWVTFHQSYSYEEFVVGKFPVPEDGGIKLQPFFGLLMNAAVALKEAGPDHGHIIVIDEINRANASQVFGEFITLLDADYRATIDSEDNPNALKIKLPGIRYRDGQSEEIGCFDGDDVKQLDEDWTFPENLYILATMNSVDRAALPLDSALTRRFHKIEMAPDIKWLSEKFEIDMQRLTEKVIAARSGEAFEDLSAEETTVLLMDRINGIVAGELGKDFELGHALFLGVANAAADQRWLALATAWDSKIYPQLSERFVQNSDAMRAILKVADQDEVGAVFTERQPIGGGVLQNAPVLVRPLSTLSEEDAASVLRHIAI